ncbi:hypothetical protein HDU76_007960, partial [Blyttiomyces sp. JEL0837]
MSALFCTSLFLITAPVDRTPKSSTTVVSEVSVFDSTVVLHNNPTSSSLTTCIFNNITVIKTKPPWSSTSQTYEHLRNEQSSESNEIPPPPVSSSKTVEYLHHGLELCLPRNTKRVNRRERRVAERKDRRNRHKKIRPRSWNTQLCYLWRRSPFIAFFAKLGLLVKKLLEQKVEFCREILPLTQMTELCQVALYSVILICHVSFFSVLVVAELAFIGLPILVFDLGCGIVSVLLWCLGPLIRPTLALGSRIAHRISDLIRKGLLLLGGMLIMAGGCVTMFITIVIDYIRQHISTVDILQPSTIENALARLWAVGNLDLDFLLDLGKVIFGMDLEATGQYDVVSKNVAR